ncbi:MAG: TonB-dependent receptor [Acidobacteriota bacterium]|nr:TonB-dependent receptor [Acidobacteriota bacterium]
MSIGLIDQIFWTLLACAFLLTLLAPDSFSQQNTGSIKGTIIDQLGSLIVNATVVAKDPKGAERKVTSSSTGRYELGALPPGYYDLRVVAPGFGILEEENVEVKSGRTTTIDLQLSVASLEQSITINNKGVSTDSDRNADALVLGERDLEALPNDPQALAAALQAMAGPTEQGNSPQIKVDGFSSGQIPPKEAIREIRVNQNPYSAENEYPGWGGIEIYTQPGSDKWHGGAAFGFNDESLNSRNPFAPRRAPYQQRSLDVNVSGPIVPKRASFSFYAGRYESDSNAIVNATILDLATLRPLPFNQSFVTPQVSQNMRARGDLKINKAHTVVGNYEYSDFSQDLQGIGGFSLPSRAFGGRRSNHTLQLTETAVLNDKTINETRLQLIHTIFRQTSDTTVPALNVLDSFFGGGAQTGSAFNRQDRMELQNFTSWSVGQHFLKVGARIRYVRVMSVSPANFGGTYTFAGGVGPSLDANDQIIPGGEIAAISSLERYRRTLLFQRRGLSAADIRSLGGGATQFSIAGGNPEADVKQSDISLYAQDEWKLRPNFTISPGLRYENQNNIHSPLNFAPRIAFAWSPATGSKKNEPQASADKNTATARPTQGTQAKPAVPSQSKTVIRGGIGIFYNRISEDLILDALRFNGLNQQQFVVSDPSVLDLFPVVPAINLLDGFAQPQTRRFLGPSLAPSSSLRASFSLERQLPHNLKLTLSYSHSQTFRTLRTLNINAPLGGTYDPRLPSSGLRPLGQSAGNILEYQSSGRSMNNSLSVSINANGKKLNFWSTYSFRKSTSTDNGTSGSPFDPYDFSNEWGRSSYDVRHFFYASGSYQAPFGFSLNSFLIANSGTPFNITTGRDTNGDTFFSERPAFTTDLTKPGVIVTPFGAFDPNPVPGQRIIPLNFGHGPGFLLVNLGVGKTVKFGPPIPPKTPPAASTGNVVTAASSQKPPAEQPIQRPYQLSFSIYATNALNHTNRGNPVGNMASPYFLQSTASSGIFFFGPGGGGSGGNRQLTLRVRFSF